MKESYREGIANHSGPEPCEGVGNDALEALDRGICRLGIELRNGCFRTPMTSDLQKATRMYAVNASVQTVLRSRRPQACRETSCARTGRPRCRPWQYDGPEGERDER